MKKFLLVILLIASMLGCAMLPAAAKIRITVQSDREQANSIIRRTAVVIQDAQQAAGRGRHSQGLGRAVAHHRYSIRQSNQRNYRDAIYHSLRARELAGQVLRNNRRRLPRESNWNDDELYWKRRGPSNAELDRKVARLAVGDNESVQINIQLNL